HKRCNQPYTVSSGKTLVVKKTLKPRINSRLPFVETGQGEKAEDFMFRTFLVQSINLLNHLFCKRPGSYPLLNMDVRLPDGQGYPDQHQNCEHSYSYTGYTCFDHDPGD